MSFAAVVVLSLFVVIQTAIWSSGSVVKAAENEASKLAKDLVGTWALAGTPGEEKEPPAKGGRLKFFGAKNWTITQADPDTGAVVFHHGGTFTLDGNKYSETIEYASEGTKDLIGKTLHFTIKIEDDKLTQQGIDNSYNEIWKRVK
jgi:hypothetical protein